MNERLKKMLMMDYATKNPQVEVLFGNENQGGLFGNLANINPNLLIGSNIFGAGIKGKDAFSQIMPSVLQAAQIKKAFKGNRKTKKVKNRQTGAISWATEEMIANNPDLIPHVTKMYEDSETAALGNRLCRRI